MMQGPGREAYAYIWNPIAPRHEELSKSCLARARHDIQELKQGPRIQGVHFHVEEEDITRIQALVMGPRDTPYEGGFFHFAIKLPPDYPYSPPRVRFLTTDANRVRFHPQLDSSGAVLLRLLGKVDGQCSWTPSRHSVRTVLATVRSLMTTRPLKVGGDELPYELWNSDAIHHETLRVAFCDLVAAELDGKTIFPDYFRRIIESKLTATSGWYGKILYEKTPLDGTNMLLPLCGHVTVFQHGALFERLQEMFSQHN
ncbi:hypothetical protein MTO96_032866 [Rhipicephalus appendiculatus]